MPARYIALEGVDGCGKSTQVKLLAPRLDALATREPGGTGLGQRIRGLILDPSSTAVLQTEALLMNADRVQHIEEIVVPTLATGKHVVSDRCYLSSLAFQAYGSGLPLSYVRKACELGVSGHYPDRIVLLDLDIEEVERRRGLDKKDRAVRFEVEARAFRERVILGYQTEAAADPGRITVISASGSIEQVQQRIWAQIEPLLN